MFKFIAGILFFMSTMASAAQVVNVYNWSGYLPPKVLKLFEQQTGVHVNYSTFETDEELYTKIKADGGADYDVIVPTSYIVQRLKKQGLLQTLDKTKLSNFKYLNKSLLNQSYDPNNTYSVPYLWGTTGIVVNTNYIKAKDVRNWRDLWKKEFYGKISMMDDMRDTFAASFISLGYSINDTNPKHIYQAYKQLVKLLPNIQSFNADGSQQMYINEDATIGMIDSGDAANVKAEMPSLHFVYPKDGVMIWVDDMVIPKGASHLENAYRFMNFIMRPKIAAMIAEGVGYSTPNTAALKLMPKAFGDNHILNPSKKDLQNAEVEGDVGVKARRLYLKYWELLKLG